MNTEISPIQLKIIRDLSRYLNTNVDKLKFGALRPKYQYFRVPKSSGGYREIEAPARPLKWLQKNIMLLLNDIYNNVKPSCSYGFIPFNREDEQERTIIANAVNHTNKKFVLNIDLADFFHSINSVRIKELFESDIFNYSTPLATILAMLTTYNNRLPMGAPTSPVLSNLICIGLDGKLMKFAENNNYTYTRYADDITFSGDEKISDTTIKQIKGIINEEGFKVNEKKLRQQSYNSRQMVTGLIVNNKPNINRRYIRKIRAIIYNLHKNGLEEATKKYYNTDNSVQKQMDSFLLSLRGKITFVGYVRGKEDGIYRKLNSQLKNINLK